MFEEIKKPVKNFLGWMASSKYINNDNFLRCTGAFSFSLLCGLQAVAIKVNNQVPEDSKKFMIPQELIEGVMKISVFMVMASGFGVIGKKLVESGMILPKSLIDEYSLTSTQKAGDFVKAVLNLAPKNEDPVKFEKFCGNIAKSVGTPDIQFLRGKAGESLKHFYGGMGTATNILGMIVGLSIVAPPVRNAVAQIFQREMKKQDQVKKSLTGTPASFNVLESSNNSLHPFVSTFKTPSDLLSKTNLVPRPLLNTGTVQKDPVTVKTPMPRPFQMFNM